MNFPSRIKAQKNTGYRVLFGFGPKNCYQALDSARQEKLFVSWQYSFPQHCLSFHHWFEFYMKTHPSHHSRSPASRFKCSLSLPKQNTSHAGHEPENHSKGSCCQLLDIDLPIKNQAPPTVDLEYLTDHTAAGSGRKQLFRFSTKLIGRRSMIL